MASKKRHFSQFLVIYILKMVGKLLHASAMEPEKLTKRA